MSDPLPTSSPLIEVRKSPVHGTGIFAAQDIPKGKKVLRYVGKKILKSEGDDIYNAQFLRHMENPHEDGSVYIFELNKKYDIDGNVPWNTARFINHSCDPNCEAENSGNHIWIKAKHNIKKGEELNYNYGYDIEHFLDHPCRCGSKRCVGFIVSEDQWPKLKARLDSVN